MDPALFTKLDEDDQMEAPQARAKLKGEHSLLAQEEVKKKRLPSPTEDKNKTSKKTA